MALADAGVVQQAAQWTADKFWNQLQAVAAAGRSAHDQLAAQKLRLQHAYTAARNKNDAAEMTRLDPLIHRNSELRIQYADLSSRYNSLVEQVRGFLAQHNINEPPVLAGLGQLQAILVPVAWAAVIAGLWAVVNTILDGIKQIDKELGPVGDMLVVLLPFALIAAAVFLAPKFLRSRAA